MDMAVTDAFSHLLHEDLGALMERAAALRDAAHGRKPAGGRHHARDRAAHDAARAWSSVATARRATGSGSSAARS